MKINDNKFQKGIPGIIIRDFLIYSIFLFILIFSIGSFINYYVSSLLPSNRIEKLISKASNWDDFDFPQRNVSYYVGDRGRLFLLDKDGSIIFTNYDLAYSDFVPNDLECIPDYLTQENYSLCEYKTLEGEKRYLLIRELLSNQSARQIQGYLIMDSDRNIIDGNLFPEKTKLSQIQLSYLMGYDIEGLKIQKYSYQNKLGQHRILVICTSVGAKDKYGEVLLEVNHIAWFFILIYILIVLCYSHFFYRKLKKRFQPINMAIKVIDDRKESLGIIEQSKNEIIEMAEKIIKLEERLAQSEWENAYLDNSKYKLLADISHDIRTPITVIQGCALALRDGIVPVLQQKKYVETILKKSERVAELVNTFHEYSKLQHPDMPLNFIKQDVCSILQIYFANKYDEIDLAGFTVEAEIQECCVYCKIDERLFYRALENLVNNSLKYNPPGTSVFVKLIAEENQAKIFIGDTGIGISKNLEEKLFDPFVTGENSRSSEYGSGLGLSITKKIVTLHHGTIAYIKNSKHNCKTEFEISLPIVK